MKNALDDVDVAFTKQSGIKVRRQLRGKLGADEANRAGRAGRRLCLSADIDWMDYGIEQKLIKNDTRINLLGNRLVLIAPKDSKIGNVTIAPGFDLAALAGYGRIATGDVRAVPGRPLCQGGAGEARRLGERQSRN